MSSLQKTSRCSTTTWPPIGSAGPPSRNASKYRLEISPDADFKQLVEEAWLDAANADLMRLRVDAPEHGTYFWRVSTMDDDGYESSWSQALLELQKLV